MAVDGQLCYLFSIIFEFRVKTHTVKKTQATFLNIMSWKLNIPTTVRFQICHCPVSKQHHH